MKKILLSAVLLLAVIGLKASSLSAPWTFWYWMYGAVSKEGIHADLCGMKDIGLGGCYLMPIRSAKEKPEFKGEAEQLSPEFWDRVDYAFQQADSLGLGMGIHICDGFALAGFPTIKPSESMQKIVWADTIVNGGSLKGLRIRRPESYQGYYEDIATFAIRCKERPEKLTPVSVKLSEGISNKKGYWLASKPSTITFDYGKQVTVRSMYVEPEGNNVQSERLLVEVSNNGKDFHAIRQLVPPRQGWQNTGCGYTFALPETSARYFRFAWKPEGTEPGSEDLDAAKWKALLKLRAITLLSESRIDNYEGKTGRVWRIAADSLSLDGLPIATGNVEPSVPIEYVKSSDCIRLTPETKSLPKGIWRIIRIGHTSTGQMNATAGGAKGLEVDKFSRSATMKLLNGWFKKFMEREHSNVIKFLHVDSWECQSQNWGEDFAEEFKKRRGYDLIPFLPVMCGVPMISADKTETVLHDVRLTINDLVNDVFFKTVADVAHSYNLQVSHESIAPTFVADGIEHYKSSDVPMGEFWLNSPTHDKPSDMLDAISGAHVYGKNIVQAEGFTEVRGVWNETPNMLKGLLDRNFCLGMNRLFFHVDAHNPWMDRRPGMTLDGIGLFMQRDNTWYKESKGLVDYITHCQEELQKGTPAVDIAVFTGEDIPSRSLTPDRLVFFLPGLFGEQRVKDEKKRFANEGQPMEESPVGVTHSANIFTFDGWSNALHGYKYDCINKDALMNCHVVSNSSDGARINGLYRVLVVPQRQVSPTVKARIDRLRKEGVIIIERPYNGSNLSALGLEPQVLLPEGIDYTARKLGEDGWIFFLSNQSGKATEVTASFRNAARLNAYVEQMSAAGHFEISQPQCAKDNGSRKEVSLWLPKDGSAFVYLLKNKTLKPSEKYVKSKSIALNGDWTLRYETADTTTTVTLPHNWAASSNDKEKYFSGHATYSTEFKWKGTTRGKRAILHLSSLNDVAHVFVNGHDCGIVWTEPYDVILPGEYLLRGKNRLDITVVNTWHNALLGQALGKSPFAGIWTNAKYRMKGKKTIPAGLTGTVVLEMQSKTTK